MDSYNNNDSYNNSSSGMNSGLNSLISSCSYRMSQP
jgi:hypothetical protein